MGYLRNHRKSEQLLLLIEPQMYGHSKNVATKFWNFKDMYLSLKLLHWTSVRKHGWRMWWSLTIFHLNWFKQRNSLRLSYPGLNTGACTFGHFSLKHMVLVYCGTWRSVPIVLDEAGNVLQLSSWDLHKVLNILQAALVSLCLFAYMHTHKCIVF